MSAKSLHRKWQHEIQVALLRRRAERARAVLPNPAARAQLGPVDCVIFPIPLQCLEKKKFEDCCSSVAAALSGCQHMVDQLQCDSCLESSDAQNAQRVSLATPPKLWQALKVDIFELKGLSSESFLFPLYGRLQNVVVFMLSGRESSAADWMQHYPQFHFLISDPGGCFVCDELRKWAGVRGIGLLTALGEFYGFTADLVNLIRVIKRLAIMLADDHPELTLASCVSLACSLEDTRRSNGLLEQTMRCTVSLQRCPLRLGLSGNQR